MRGRIQAFVPRLEADREAAGWNAGMAIGAFGAPHCRQTNSESE